MFSLVCGILCVILINYYCRYLLKLEPQFEKKGWKLVRSANQFLGAARNLAVSHARGDYVFFLDDDNLARPNLLSTYVAVAESNPSADIFTAAHDVFEGSGEVPARVIGRWVPLGGSPVVGLFKNCFGDGIYYILFIVLGNCLTPCFQPTSSSKNLPLQL